MRRFDVQRMMRAAGEELDRFCEEWVGWTLPPVNRAIEEAFWSPSPRDEYCHRCGQSVGEGEAGPAGCGACRGVSLATVGVVRLGSYRQELRQWILAVKFSQWHEMGRRLGRELGAAVRSAGLTDPKRTIVMPMPMPWLRRMHRGIDHATVMAGGAAEVLGAPVMPILARADGPTQLAVPKSARRVNARQGLRVRWRWGGWRLNGLHIVIVDDVRTSGSSMAAAARLLRPLGAERIIEAVVAVAEPGRRGVKSQAAEAVEEPA